MSQPAPVALALSAATVTVKFDADRRRFTPAGLQARITNIGRLNDQFTLEVLDLPPTWYTRDPESVLMRPGVDDTISVTFLPPRAPESTAGPHSFKIRVTPREQPTGYVEFGATLTVEPFVDTSLALVEPSQTTDGDAVYRVRLRNQGNLPLTYTLSALPGEGQEPLAFAFAADARGEATLLLTVEPGRESTPELRVSAPPINGVDRRPGSYLFSVQATAVNPGGGTWPELKAPPLTATGTFILKPPAPVETSITPNRVELVDLVAKEAECTVRVLNPSRRLIGVLLEAKATSADYEVTLEQERLVLLPESDNEVKLTVRRAPLAPLAAAPLRQPFQLTVKQIDLPAEPDPSRLPAPIAAPGSVIVTMPPPVEVVIQPPGLRAEVTPRRRRGGKGRYKVVVRNQGTQRVKALLDLHEPDHALDYVFGHQEAGIKAWFKRIFWRWVVPEAERAVYRRIPGRGTQVMDAAGIESPSEQAPQEQTSRSRAMPVMLEPQAHVEVPLEVKPARTRLVGRSALFQFQVQTVINNQPIESLTREAEFEHRPLPILLLLLLLLLIIAPIIPIVFLKLGCDRGTLEFAPYCVPGPNPVPAPAALRQEGGSDGKTKVALREGSALRVVAEEPSAILPGQFAKLVVPSPDKDRVLYVTAKDELLNGAVMMVADKNGTKNQLKAIDKGLWVAKPVWCQRQEGDPGKIAYVTFSEPSAGKSGLQLWVRTLEGAGEEKMVLDGTTGQRGNGFVPALFYGARETPLRWWDGCQALKYGEPDGKRWVVDLRADTPTVSEIRQFNLPGAQPVSAQARPSASACEEQFVAAQTDPAWAQRPIGKPGGPVLGAHGCALAAAAMVYRYYGIGTTPNALLSCAPDEVDFFQWREVAAKCAQGKVSGTVWKENPTYQDLSDAIRARQPAIVGLAGGPTGSHYLVVAGGAGETGADFRIWDPWDGTTYKRLNHYLDTGSYRLKYLVRYEGTAPQCAVSAGSEAPLVRFSGIQDGGTARQPVRVQFEVPSGAQHQASHPSGTQFDKDGFYSVGVALADGAYRSLSFYVDRTPPKTTAAWAPDKDKKDKFGGVLTLLAKDTITPVALTRFQIDGGPWREYTGDREGLGNTVARGLPLEFEEIGEHRVRFKSTDAAGNEENDAEFAFTVGEGVLPPKPQIVPGGQLNFGRTEVQKVVTLTVDGVGVLRWKAVVEGKGISVEPPDGVIKAGEQKKLTVKVDRGVLEPGDFTGRVTVASQVGQTDVSATIEVIGNQVGPTPTPTPSVAQATATAGAVAAATAAGASGRGAGVGAEEPVVEPNELSIRAAQLTGTFSVREKLNVRMEWYVESAPDWLILEVNGAEVLPQQRVLTNANTATTVTARPDWGKLRPGETREGVVVVRDSSNRYRAELKVRASR